MLDLVCKVMRQTNLKVQRIRVKVSAQDLRYCTIHQFLLWEVAPDYVPINPIPELVQVHVSAHMIPEMVQVQMLVYNVVPMIVLLIHTAIRFL